jgi:hypothetical protein
MIDDILKKLSEAINADRPKKELNLLLFMLATQVQEGGNEKPSSGGNDLIERIAAIYVAAGKEMPSPAVWSLRFIEEAVELSLASGAGPAAILAHVSDALANEARKQGVPPSEMAPKVASMEERAGECADIAFLFTFLRRSMGINMTDMMGAARAKVEDLEEAFRDGRIVFKPDGRLYRKKESDGTVITNTPDPKRHAAAHLLGKLMELHKLADEYTTALDLEADDIGVSRPSKVVRVEMEEMAQKISPNAPTKAPEGGMTAALLDMLRIISDLARIMNDDSKSTDDEKLLAVRKLGKAVDIVNHEMNKAGIRRVR